MLFSRKIENFYSTTNRENKESIIPLSTVEIIMITIVQDSIATTTTTTTTTAQTSSVDTKPVIRNVRV